VIWSDGHEPDGFAERAHRSGLMFRPCSRLTLISITKRREPALNEIPVRRRGCGYCRVACRARGSVPLAVVSVTGPVAARSWVSSSR
jgi:hypothetical protein